LFVPTPARDELLTSSRIFLVLRSPAECLFTCPGGKEMAMYLVLKAFSCSPMHIEFWRFNVDPTIASVFSLTPSHLPSRSLLFTPF
jgi:hypothetical protein